MSRADYAYKARLLVERPDMLATCKAYRKLRYLREQGVEYDREWAEGVEDALSYFLTTANIGDFNECERIVHANNERVKRLRKRIAYMLRVGSVKFCTFTFTDDTLSATSPDTRRQYIRKFLKSVSDMYIANIDFSPKDREHYHALACADYIDKKPAEKWGFVSVKDVRDTDGDVIRLSRYVSKLANHAIKETAKRNHIIYSDFNPIYDGQWARTESLTQEDFVKVSPDKIPF